jgi:hypothetical protein
MAKPFNTLDEDDAERLREYVTRQTPFGPIDARAVSDPVARWVLFNQHNDLCKEYRRDPRIIVGRRGSGKTSIIMNAERLDSHEFVARVVTQDAIRQVVDTLFEDDKAERQFVETIAKIWDVTLNSTLMAHVVAAAPDADLPTVRRFLLGAEIDTGSNLVRVLRSLKKRAGDLSGAPAFSIRVFFDFIESNDLHYAEAIEELDGFLRKRGTSAVTIMDSLEDYHLEDPHMKQALRGLLRCVGEYGSRRRQIRLCIKGEAYFEIRGCSASPLKDFAHNLLLQWSPTELFGVIAWRVMLYCRLYDPEMYLELPAGDFRDRKYVLGIVNRFLIDKVRNGLGQTEPTLPYILRHTQLLPRQVMVMMNAIFGGNGGDCRRWREKPTHDVCAAVKGCEPALCEEIFSAFESKYPMAWAFCEKTLPELPRLFADGDLRRAFNRHGKAVIKATGFPLEYEEFRQMLVEMGAVGRVRKVTGIYAEADFEYAQPGRLHLSVDDQLCVHPLFSGEFESSRNMDLGVVVYPQQEWFDEDARPALAATGGRR